MIPATPEIAIRIIGLTLKKKTQMKHNAHIMMLMLFSPNPTSGKLAEFIMSNAAANINPAMNGLRFFKVVLTTKLSLFLNRNLKTKYNKIKDGSTIANDASSEPNIPPVWYPT